MYTYPDKKEAFFWQVVTEDKHVPVEVEKIVIKEVLSIFVGEV